MLCPNCGHLVYRPSEQSWDEQRPVRTYTCAACGYVFETVEVLRETARLQAFQSTLFRVINESREGMRT